jgi:hypothetical protein
VHVIYGTLGAIDWQRLLQIVGEHWELLLWELLLFHYVYPAQQDYVPRHVWDDLLARFRRQLDSGSANLPFRGSLIDEKMFSIDMKEWGMENLLREQREHRQPKIEESAVAAPLVKAED